MVAAPSKLQESSGTESGLMPGAVVLAHNGALQKSHSYVGFEGDED